MIPYSKIVRYPGNQALFDAIEMSVLATLCGRPLHLHAEGLRGTGKTTILRAARQMFPPLLRVAGCRYNCHPAHPHCPEHRHLSSAELASLGTEWVPVPFLEISHSAKLGTVVGSIDLGRLTSPQHPEAALLPGTIPQAHRGIIFVDEINRLAETSPELTDVLLGVMGTRPGRVQIEETGLPVVSLEVNACVWAASNPDEDPGPLEDIRRQLADRFDLVVSMGRPAAPEAVRSVLEVADSYFGTASGSGFEDRNVLAGVLDSEIDWEANRARWQRAVQWVPQVRVADNLRATIASLYVDFGLESLRAVEAWQLGARMRAALAGRKEVELSDFVALAPLVLRHRVDMSTLSDLLARLDQAPTAGDDQKENRCVQVPAAAPARHGEASLGQLLSRARERLSSLMGGAAAQGSVRSGRGSPGGSPVGGGGASAVSDPTRLALASPPAPARPLIDLPPALWIREE